MRRTPLERLVVPLAALALSQSAAGAQSQSRDNLTGTWALVNARIETVTRGTIDRGTVVIRDGVIEAVGVERMPPVVFVTAYDEHALRAFEVQALDYLLKPVSPERLDAVLARLRREPTKRNAALDARVAALMRAVDRPAPMRHLLVWQGERARLVPVDTIDRLEADRNVVRVHAGADTHTIRGTLSDIASRLDPERFLRVSRSHIVRLDAVKELQPWFHGDYRIVMRNGVELMWSRRYRARSRGAFEPR